MDVNKIGERIKQARDFRNYTLDDIASDIGVTKSTIQRYENGLITKPKLPVLQAIASSLRVNPAWISGQDVPMLNDDSLEYMIDHRLNEIGMTKETLSELADVSLYWLQNIGTFSPGELGPYEIGYEWITRVANVIGLPAAELRTALARQEIPFPNDLSPVSAKEAFRDASVISVFPKKTDREAIMIQKYRSIDEKGKHTVDTILEMEYARCKDAKPILNAAHERTDIEVTDEMRKHDDDIMNDPDEWK